MQAKQEKGAELEQKRFAQDSVIEKKAKNNEVRRLEHLARQLDLDKSSS